MSMFSSIDQELARAAEDALTLGEHQVTRMEDRFRRPRQNYARLYKVSLPSPPAAALATFSVPGFPDFPECWQGFEGGAALGIEHNDEQSSKPFRSNGRKKQTTAAPRQTQIWKRKAVNKHACRKKQSKIKSYRDKYVNNKSQLVSAVSCKLANLKIQQDVYSSC